MPGACATAVEMPLENLSKGGHAEKDCCVSALTVGLWFQQIDWSDIHPVFSLVCTTYGGKYHKK